MIYSISSMIFLDISKIESGQLDVKMEDCDIKDLFAELGSFFHEYQVRIDKKHINFSLHCLSEPSQSIILTDKIKLKQILINLIENAFKFTSNGSIVCSCKTEGSTVEFSVSDTGIGIPKDKHVKIFERFFQINHPELRNIGGTGLGLSITKSLVELLGGTIWLESEEGKGTTFYFSIQHIPSTVIPKERLILRNYMDVNFINKVILVVEDDRYNLAYLKEILSHAGYAILSAENGKEAVQIATTHPIDLVLMDIRLPDMNGYEAIYQILQSNPLLKIIAQTAYAANPKDKKHWMPVAWITSVNQPKRIHCWLYCRNTYPKSMVY